MSAATPNVIPVIEMKVLSEMVRVRRLARRYRSPTKFHTARSQRFLRPKLRKENHVTD